MIEEVATIVAAYLTKNSVAPTEIPALISQVNTALTHLGQAPAREGPLSPAVPIRRSVTPEALICLDCGFRSQMLKRHLSNMHGLTPMEYRARWNLPINYPIVAPSYAQRRSELAKRIGLGSRARRRGKQAG